MNKGWKVFLWLVLIVGLCASGWLGLVPKIQEARYQASIIEIECEIVDYNDRFFSTFSLPQDVEIVRGDGEKITLTLESQKLFVLGDNIPGEESYSRRLWPGLREFILDKKDKPFIHEDMIYVWKIDCGVYYRLKYAGVGKLKKILEIELIKDRREQEVDELISSFEPSDIENWILEEEYLDSGGEYNYRKAFEHPRDYATGYGYYDILFSKEKPTLKKVIVVFYKESKFNSSELWTREVWMLDEEREWIKTETGWSPKTRQI